MSKQLDKSENRFQTECVVLCEGIIQLIEKAQKRAALFLNNETTLLYWSIGKYINTNLKENKRTAYGKKIIATLSQQLIYTNYHITKEETVFDHFGEATKMVNLFYKWHPGVKPFFGGVGL